MQLAFITPTAYLEKFSAQGNFYLALAHLIDDEGTNKYAAFHRREAQQGRTVMLDNGLFEGAQVPPDSLIRRAKVIGAQVVCAPDVLYNSSETIKEFKNFIRLKQEQGLVCKVMGIPQADNPAQWWECFRFMEMCPDCDIIGLSILSIPQSFADRAGQQFKQRITHSRMYIIRELYNFQSILGRRIKPCHLLGLGESYSDIILADRLLPNVIKTNDSSSAFIHGMKGKLYNTIGEIPGGKDLEKLDFSYNKLALKQYEDIQSNIDQAKLISRWTPNDN